MRRRTVVAVEQSPRSRHQRAAWGRLVSRGASGASNYRGAVQANAIVMTQPTFAACLALNTFPGLVGEANGVAGVQACSAPAGKPMHAAHSTGSSQRR